MMRRATVLVAVLLASTLTFCVRAGGEDERAVTDRTLDQLGTPARTSDGVKLTAGSDRLRGAVEARGRLDPATLRARWEAAARGDLPESKPHAPSATEEEPSVKSSDELGRVSGEEAAPNDVPETPATGEGDSPSEGKEAGFPIESIEVLEVELKELRASADAAEARAKQAREAIELEQLAADVRKTFGDGECKRDDISGPMAYLGDEDTRPGYLVSFGDSKDGEIVANWCRTTGYAPTFSLSHRIHDDSKCVPQQHTSTNHATTGTPCTSRGTSTLMSLDRKRKLRGITPRRYASTEKTKHGGFSG